jgi:chromosomal replication initiation ATPase DnaA
MSPDLAIRDWGARKAQEAQLRSARKLPPLIEAMFRDAEKEFHITRSEIVGPRQFAPFVRAREVIAYKLRQRGCSLCMIGIYLGDRHHTTIRAYLLAHKPEAPVDWSIPDESGAWAI